MAKSCIFPGCEKTAVSFGHCPGHTFQREQGRELAPLRPRRSKFEAPFPCRFEGCDRPADSRGLCTGHYQQELAGRPLRPLRPSYESDICAFPGCERPRRSFGLCDGHYYQQRQGYELRPIDNRDGEPLAWLEKALASRLRDNACWLDWPYAMSRSGEAKISGEVYLRPHLNYEGRIVKAAQLVLFLESGEWPENALHHCDTPPCLNPRHLYDGSQKDNSRDSVERGRHYSYFRDGPIRA